MKLKKLNFYTPEDFKNSAEYQKRVKTKIIKLPKNTKDIDLSKMNSKGIIIVTYLR